MKPRATLGVLALALLMVVPSPASSAGGSPAAITEPAKNEGCAGETYRVSMVRHAFSITREHAPGNRSPTGFLRISDFDLSVSGTFVRELRDGKLKWVSRIVDWRGQSSDNVPECHSVSCDAAGQLELGPADGGEGTMTNGQQAQMKWHCKPLKRTGNCFGYFPFTPTSVPFPEIRVTHDKLRSGCCYSAVDRDGTRYSETVEQRGNEQVSISADPTEIVPNQSGNNPDEATSELIVKVTCDGAPLKDRQVGLRIDVKPRSGYHNHVDKRPRGKLAVGKKETSCGVETGAPEGTDDKSCLTAKTDANGEAKPNSNRHSPAASPMPSMASTIAASPGTTR
jgi:hypothetical protein